MKSFLRNLFLPVAGLALAATAATAATWPPAPGDLILAVQATGGTGSTTNVFFNLGPAHTLRDNPSPAGTLVNLDAELTAAFGAGWSSRSDLYFGVIANRSNATPSGIGSAAPENGDPARTIYASKGVATAGAGTPWSGFSVSALGLAATAHQGQIAAIDNIAANGNNVMTLTQAANSVEWNNSWTQFNPTPGAGFSIVAGGIQAKINATAALVDVFRIVSTSGSGSYVTTVSLAANGDVTAARAGAATSYYIVTANATNGSVSGGGAEILYAAGTTAKLTASAASGYVFTSWSGDASGSTNPISLTMDSNKTVTANFALPPTVTTPTATAITGTEATLGGNVTSDGGQPLTERGVVFALNSTNSNPQIGGSGVTQATAAGTATGVFTTPVSSLTAGTTYAYTAYATGSAGTGYSAVGRFTTDTTIPFTGGVGTLTGREILAGDTQLFRFNIAADTVADFTSTGATDWELRDGTNLLIDSGTGLVNFADILPAGDYTLRLTNSAGTPVTVSLDLDASSAAEPKTDVSVGSAATAPVGIDVYSPTAQSVAITSSKANAVTGYFAVDNDGSVDDTFKVQASAGNSNFAVSYFQGADNVTAQVVAGTFTTASLSKTSSAVIFRAAVTPNKKTLIKKKKGAKPKTVKATYTSIVKATASSDASLTDTATIVVRTQ
jgi:uncharacterized repeat protein (TIGR02543 family)